MKIYLIIGVCNIRIKFLSMNKIIFRCDAGYKKEIGTGHLVRSITLAKMLIKYEKFQRRNILFIVKTNKEFSISKKILGRENFSYYSIKNYVKDYSNEELSEILKLKFKLLIVDRLGKINLTFIKKIKENKKNIICFDDSSKNKFLCDMSFNPLIFDKEYVRKNHFSGYEYNILPSSLFKKKIKKNKKIKSIFMSFGGFDSKNLMKSTQKLLKKRHKYNLMSNLNNMNFKNQKNFFDKMKSSDLVISSGGLTMFDALNFNKFVIAIPQYQHQIKNIKRLEKKGLVKLLLKKNLKHINNEINKIKNDKQLKLKLKKINHYNKAQKFKMIIKKIKHICEKKN